MKKLIPVALAAIASLGALLWWLNDPRHEASNDSTKTTAQTITPESPETTAHKSNVSNQKPSHTAASVRSEQTAPGRVPGRKWPEPHEEELLALSPEQQALVIFHIDPAKYSDLASFVFELEDRVNSGMGGELDLAEIYRDCHGLTSANLPPTNADSKDIVLRARYHMREMCKTLPDRGIDYYATLITNCAKRGDRDCILREQPPASIAAGINPRSPEAIAWGQEMMGRLMVLADAGDREAAMHAATHLTDGMNPYDLQDYRQAAKYLDYLISSATDPLLDPYRLAAKQRLIHICGSVNREEWNEQCR